MVNGNGTVTDQVTGLVWQQTDGGEMTYANAITYCQNLELAGYTDWKLPSRQQLFQHRRSRSQSRAEHHRLSVTTAEYWWSPNAQVNDSTKSGSSMRAAASAPSDERDDQRGRHQAFHTAACAMRRQATNELTANGNGTVTDDNTGLIWQQAEVTPTLTWEGALTIAKISRWAATPIGGCPTSKNCDPSATTRTPSRRSIRPTSRCASRSVLVIHHVVRWNGQSLVDRLHRWP